MLDIKDSETSNVENQQFASENNANTVNNDSNTENQTNSNHDKLDDNTLYDNMIFPS